MLNAVLAYINNHLEEEISLDQLSKFTGYSSFHLHRKLKDEMNEPIGNFIVRQRIQKAGYLLSLTRLPVAEVRSLVGYDNDSAFSRAFKRFYQTSPSVYRQQQLQKHLTNGQSSYVSLKAEVVRVPKQRGIVFPAMANYLSKESYKVWSNVKEYIANAGLNENDFEYMSILHDCQMVNEDSTSRYDAVIVHKGEANLPASKYFTSNLPSGKFVKYKFCCPVSEYKNMGAHINKHLFEESGLEHKQGASFFKFQQLPQSDHADHLLIEWFIPIK